MRYRKLSSTGDYTFGQGLANFWIDVPQAVAQSIQTRLNLFQGEWFLNTLAWLPLRSILGYGTKSLYDMAIRSVILNTSGVSQLLSYSSNFNPETRQLTVTSARVQTIYSRTPIETGPIVIP